MKRILSIVLCAAMLLSSIVFVTSAADAEVQAVINKIDAIGEVHRNEALLENQSYNSYMFNALGIGTDGWGSYARIDYPTGNHTVDNDHPERSLLWDRDFQITFQFVPVEVTEGTTPYFGGKISTKAWAGYNFKTQKFFIGTSTDGNCSGPGRFVKQSAVTPLDSTRAYTMRMEFTGVGISVYLDGQLMCTTVGEPELNDKGKANRNYLVFKPYEVNNNFYEWRHFYMLPSNCKCYLVGFEASSLDGVLKVNDLATNISSNGVLQPASFTTSAYVDSGAKLEAAKNAYMALTPPQKKEVTNYATLVAKLRQYYTMEPVFGGAKISDAALAVVDLIDAIGEVTTSSEGDIDTAETEYDALTAEQQAEVYNYDVLVCSREEYDSFSDPAITKLISDIDAIAPVTLESGTAIAKAEATYASFNSAQQSSVTNYDKLVQFRAEYDTLYVNHVRDVWNSIGTVTKESGDKIAEARQVWDALREDLRPRVADVKPIFDAAKTDFRILNLDECDLTNTEAGNSKGRWEVSATNEYYEVQSDEAKALVKNKAFLDQKILEANYMAQAADIVNLVNRVGNWKYMQAGGSANGLEFAGKSTVGYSDVEVRAPAGNTPTAKLFAPYTVSYDIVISKWLYNADDMTARIAAFTPDLIFGYNAHERKFMIGKSTGFAGQENPTAEYGESKVVELKFNVPYNITFELDENHVAIYLNGQKMVESTEVGMKRGDWFIFYPGGVDFLVTGYSFIHNGEIVADNVSTIGLFTTDPKFVTNNRWSWVNNDGGWKNGGVTTFDNTFRDSGYQLETAYNRYLALPDEYKQYVTNSSSMIEKYKEYSATKNEALVTDAINAITAIGAPADVTLDSLKAIESAEYAYGEVSADKRAEVTNAADLSLARENYDKLYAADFDVRVNAVGTVTAEKFATVEGLSAEYAAMSDAQKALVTSKDVLDELVQNCAEFYTADPVIEAIYSFQGLTRANYNDATPIGGGVRKTDNDPYTHISNAGSSSDASTVIGSRRYQIEFDFLYTGYDDGRIATVSGGNKTLVAGVDVGHNLVFIKNNASPFSTYDPESYDAKDPYTFRTNRWYHVTLKFDALDISVEINGEERVKLTLADSDPGPWFIMKPHGGVHGYMDNFVASTLVPEEELEDGFVRTVSQLYGPDGEDNTGIPETTIGQWNRDNVARARAMYNELSPFARTAVTNYKTLTDAEKLLGIAAPTDAAMAVIDAINELDKDSTVAEVNAVKAQYEALSAADKKTVTNAAKIDELLAALASDEAVDAVVAQINALSEASSVSDILAAKTAYDALPASQKEKVTNYARIAELLNAKAQQVKNQIAALSVESSAQDIAAASAAYDALPDDVKTQVDNYAHLTEIIAAKESQVAVANVQAKIDAINDTTDYETAKAAENAYNALNDEQKAQITGFSRIAERYAAIAKVVEDKIAALTNDSSDADIDAATVAYDSLPNELKALVTNYDHLTEVKQSHVSEAVANVIDMILALDVNSSPDKLVAAIQAYAALSDAEKAQVWNYDSLVQIINDKAAAVTARIAALPEVEGIDVYHFQREVNGAMNDYNALPAEIKEQVTNFDKLQAAAAKIADLIAWNDNKQVNILNSTLKGFGAYTPEQIAEFAQTPSIGIYYYFEEVDLLEQGDSTSGYYSLDGEKDNFLVEQTKYAKLDFDIKVTDMDVINGWPAFFKMTTGMNDTGYIGYDALNKCFFHGYLTGGGGDGMDHGYIASTSATTPCDFTLGVWHHMTVVWDGTNAVIEFDGEKVLDCETPDLFKYLIIYPWLCNLEMTNVHYFTKAGDDTLSPFRNALTEPTGWARSTNEAGTTMLDLVKESVDDAKAAYDRLSDEQKAQIVGYENIEKLEKMIENAGKNEVAVENGSADVKYAAEGDTVTVTAAEAPEGQVFDKWEVVSGEIELADANAASTTFTMPATGVQLKAVFKEKTGLPGDANGDGKINAKDVTAIMKYIVGTEVKDFQADLADFDGNGKINAKNVTAVMKYIVANA